MKKNIKVFLGDEACLVGYLRYNQQGARENAIFEYDTSWLSADNAFPLEPNLPLVSGSQFHQKGKDGSIFHGCFADSEPDGWGKRVILRDHAKRRQEKKEQSAPLNNLDFLLSVDDFSRVGSLRFQDAEDGEGKFLRTTENGHRTAPPFVELSHLISATRAVENNTETTSDLAYLRGRGTSLGGMRPKCTVVDEKGLLSIGKFPSIKDERAVTKGEVLALQLAKDAGIEAASARLVDSDGVPVALIKRFDRSSNGKRLMYISAATLLGVEATSENQHTYVEIVDAIRVHGAAVQKDIDELWRRIAFSILITNVDDHLLNHGFLHVEKGKWRLAPAFDVNPFPERVRELKTWISEEIGPHASVKALLSAAPYFKIAPKKAKMILSEVENAVSNWRKKAQELDMSKVEIEQFEPAFEHEEREVVQKVVNAH